VLLAVPGVLLAVLLAVPPEVVLQAMCPS